MGILLLVLFFWYLAAEHDKTKRNAGTFFIIGMAAFSLFSLFVNGMHYGIDIDGGVELTLEVQPKMDDNGNTVPPTEQDMEQACAILGERLNSTGTSEVQILHSGSKILIQIPRQDSDDAKNQEKVDAMVQMLTKMAKLELLPVYPEYHTVLANPEVQQRIENFRNRFHEYNRLDTYAEHAGKFDLKRELLAYIRADGKFLFIIYGICAVVTDISCVVLQYSPKNFVGLLTSFCLGPWAGVIHIPVVCSVLCFVYASAVACVLAMLRSRKVSQEDTMAKKR
jgi:hypothetical protein